MSEAFKKTLDIKELPVFPLPLILMPFQILPLHIFEPRYIKMLDDVRLRKNLFGISHFDPPNALIEKPAVGSIGCVAEVGQSQMLEDGRSNILTVGVVRYRIKSYLDSLESYLIVEPEFFEDRDEDIDGLKPLADDVFALFERVAKAAHKISGQSGSLPQLPQAEPEHLSFLVAAAFDLDNETKYKMLESRSTYKRLKTLKKLLSKAAERAEDSAEISQISRTNGHSKNPIDLN